MVYQALLGLYIALDTASVSRQDMLVTVNSQVFIPPSAHRTVQSCYYVDVSSQP